MAHQQPDVIEVWPTLDDATAAAEEWRAAIRAAEAQVNEPTWGPLYDLGCIHLVAHMLMLSHPESAPAAPATSETVGAISTSYAVPMPAPTNDPLDRTVAGREFKRLRESLLVGAFVI